jgi:SAM-dependent methyltransferase
MAQLRRAPAAAARRIRERFEQPPGLDRPGATFERDDGSVEQLWDGYREHLKAGWREYWWPTRVLLGVHRRATLPPELHKLAESLLAAPTLPAPVAVIARAVEPLAELYPAFVERAGDALRLVDGEEALESRRRAYASTARVIVDALEPLGLDLTRAHVLEVGCGTGYLTYALGAMGAAKAVGIDLALDVTPDAERAAMRDRFGNPERVELREADAERLPFDDGELDLVCSVSAVEHFARTAQVMRETRRVLRPGGLAYHTVHFWFGPTGGHSLCSLDFPWGHARLTEAELERYFGERRPHERDEALEFYREGFQRPRLTATETERVVRDASFEIVGWQNDAADARYRRLARGAIEDVRSVSPAAEVSDLLTNGFTLLLRAR